MMRCPSGENAHEKLPLSASWGGLSSSAELPSSATVQEAELAIVEVPHDRQMLSVLGPAPLTDANVCVICLQHAAPLTR